MPPQTLTNRTINGIVGLSIARFVSYALKVAIMMILSRLILPYEFGLVEAANIIVGFTALFSEIGIGAALVQKVEISDKHIRTGFSVSIAFGAVFCILVYIFAPHLASFFAFENLTNIIRAISFLFILRGSITISNSLLQRELKISTISYIEFFSNLAYGFVTIILANLGFGAWALVAGIYMQTLVECLSFFLISYPKKPLFDANAFNELLHFGGGITITRIATYFAIQGDNIIVGKYLGSAALGFYGKAFQIIIMPATLIGGVLDKVLFPAMASIQDQNERIKSAYKRGVSLICYCSLPISLIILILSPEIVNILLGDNWDAVITPLRIFSLGLMFRTSYKINDTLIRALAEVYKGSLLEIIYTASIFTAAFLGKSWGITGVAVNVLGAILIKFFLTTHFSLKLLKMNWIEYGKLYIKSIEFSVIIFLFTYLSTLYLRVMINNDFLIIFASLLTTTLTMIFLIVNFPRVFLDTQARWIVVQLVEKTPDFLKEKFFSKKWYLELSK